MIQELVNKVGKRNFWLATIAFLSVTLIHLFTPQGLLAIHIFIRSIYFLPIVLMGFLKGKKGGLITSLVASILMLPHFFFDMSSNEFILENVISVVLFNLTGFFVGLYSDVLKNSFFHGRSYQMPATEAFGRNVLIYLDDTPLSLRVVNWSLQFMNLHKDINLTVFFVLLNRSGPAASAKNSGPQDIEIAMEYLNKAKKTLVNNGIPEEKIKLKYVAADTTSPRPSSDKIIQELKAKKYEAVLVPKHHKTRAQEFILGDVAVRLMREAKVPVLAINEP